MLHMLHFIRIVLSFISRLFFDIIWIFFDISFVTRASSVLSKFKISLFNLWYSLFCFVFVDCKKYRSKSPFVLLCFLFAIVHVILLIRAAECVRVSFNLQRKHRMWNWICVGYPRLLMTVAMVVLEVMNAIRSIVCFVSVEMVL